MTAGRRRRRRGVTLSEHGYARVSTAQRRLELVHHDGARVSLERLSSDIGLSAKTLSRALNREMPVDLRTLEFLFAAYGLTLGTADYVAAEPFLERGATPLPQTRTTFFGREDELRRIRMLLEERRIVTLTGPGGVGKTRLAVELARDAGAHAYERIGYVDLSVINEAADIPGAVLAAFGAPQERRSPADVLLDIVDSERTLLIVDNCEHLVSDVADFAERILTAIPAARILATSREALGVDGEAVFRVAPLTQPVGFALFVERARAFDDSFEVTPTAAGMVASIVERVDGLPLAIELVAGRATLSGLQDVAESLQDRLDSIATDLDGRQPRHRSARALVDWSVRCSMMTNGSSFAASVCSPVVSTHPGPRTCAPTRSTRMRSRCVWRGSCENHSSFASMSAAWRATGCSASSNITRSSVCARAGRRRKRGWRTRFTIIRSRNVWRCGSGLPSNRRRWPPTNST